jgi:hypothetical protein
VTVYFIIPQENPVLCGGLADAVNGLLSLRDISGNADWYYDDFVEDGTEYGIKLNVSGLIPMRLEQLIAEIVSFCEEVCEDTVVVQRE